MTVEQSPLDRFTTGKQQQPPPLLNTDKDAAQSPTSGVIDLTNDSSDKEEDLKKAIALSLKEHEKVLGGQVSMEDQDISRVVEASLAESKAVGTKRKRGEAWQDPVNPHDRKRNADWPVGLKNVGNTCWFSAVIQSLFHLPIFRKLVLSYSPKDWTIEASDGKDKRNLLFMQELRKLFALLLCSKRKYVDPSHALEEFKEAFPDSSATDSQQDVSEFSHKLLEWLEEAFKINYHMEENDESMMDGSHQNPMLDLFYGHFLSEGHNEGRTFCNEETFGQYPLQVNGFSNIHESLEAAMTQEIESCDVMSKSGQESWFTKLPPVMLFELSRFQFNQQLGRPEKIHNKLEFPQVMYMDRYMEQNKNITRGKREKVRKLKEEREKLHTQLEKYLHYGSGAKRVPLLDVLQYTLEFAESRKSGEDVNSSEDVEMASPASVSSMGGDSPCNSPNKAVSMEVVANSSSGPAQLGSCLLPNSHSYEQMNCDETVPSPQHVSEVELKVLQSCLKRWRKEIESNVKNLQDSINTIENTIKEIYNESSLQKKPYRLHAVLVHEGQAASGHYWAYVYCPNRSIWLKFNDVTVSEATWTELQKDSMGGHHYASAYCLLYVDELHSELFDENKEVQIGPEYISSLPPDLQQFVEEDNAAFFIEMEQWDFEQGRKKDSSTMTVGDGDCAIIAEKKFFEDNSPDIFVSNLSMEHAILVHKATLTRIEQFRTSQYQGDVFSELLRLESLRLKRVARIPPDSDIGDYRFASSALKKCLESLIFHFGKRLLRLESLRLKRVARIPPDSDIGDYRLHHVGVYIVLNHGAPDTFLTLCITEQFLVPELDGVPNGHLIKESALRSLAMLRKTLKEDHFIKYHQWHQEYSKFRKAITLFIVGVEHYHHHHNYPNALCAFTHCCEINQALLKLPGNKRGLDVNLTEHYRRQAAVKLNELVATQFETLDTKNALDALCTAYEYIIPSMDFLASPVASEEDIKAAETIRNRWCSMLGSYIASKQNQKQERLQDFLSKLIENNDTLKHRAILQTIPRIENLEERFKQTLKVTERSGEAMLASIATK